MSAHAVDDAHRRWPGQGAGVPGVQSPPPLQAPTGVNVAPVQDGAPHVVVLGA